MGRFNGYGCQFLKLAALGGFFLVGCVAKPENRGQPNQIVQTASDPDGLTFIRGPRYSQIARAYQSPSLLLSQRKLEDQGIEERETIISADGNYSYFVSRAQLTADAPPEIRKIYRQALSTNGEDAQPVGTIELVSKRPATLLSVPGCPGIDPHIGLPEAAATGDSYSPVVSYDGTKVAFISSAPNLAMRSYCDEDPETKVKTPQAVSAVGLISQVYLLDLTTKQLTLVSGYQLPDGNRVGNEWGIDGSIAISGNGKVIAFSSSDEKLLTTDQKKETLASDLMLFNSQTGEIGWISFAGRADSPHDANGDSGEPALNQDGRYLAFTSDADLMPQDRNDGPDIYRAELKMTPDGPAVGARSNLELVSVNANSTDSYGDNANSSPSITADGRIVAFQSTREELFMVNGWKPSGSAPLTAKENPYYRVYARKMLGLESQTSLMSAALRTENKLGSKVWIWRYTDKRASAVDPVISPNGQYLLYRTIANDQYMTEKMKAYRDGDIVPGTENSCMNMVFFSYGQRFESTGSGKDFPKGSPIAGSDHIPHFIKGGWQNAIDTKCLPAIDPNTNKSFQIYRVELDPLSIPLKPVDLLPAALTPPLILKTFIAKPPVGSTAPSAIIDSLQVSYPDKDVEISRQSLTNGGNVTFSTAADNMFGKGTAELNYEKKCPNLGDTCQKILAESPINYYYRDEVGEISGDQPMFSPINIYYNGQKRDNWASYFYSPVQVEE